MDLSQYSIGDAIAQINQRLAARGVTGPRAAQVRAAVLSKLAERNAGIGGPADPAIADHAAGEQQRAELASLRVGIQSGGVAGPRGPMSNVYRPILDAVAQAGFANTPDTSDENSLLGDMGRGLIQGVLDAGPGNMMRVAGDVLRIPALEHGGAALAATNRAVARNDPALRTKQGGGFVRDVLVAASASVPNLGMQMAAGSALGPLGFAAFAAGPVFADTYAEGLQAHGDRTRALEEAAGAAAVTAATSWAQSKFLNFGGANAAPALVQGMKPLLTKAAKEYVLRFGEGALGEALQNEAEEVGQRYLREYVRGDQEAWKGWLEEMPVRAAAAGLAGGATDSAGLPQSFTTSRERRGSELARLAYVAQREEQAARKKGDAVVAQAKRAEKLELMRQAEEVLGLTQQTTPEAPAGTEDTTDEGLTDFEREAEQRAAGVAPAAPAAPKAPAKTVQANMAPGWDQNPVRGADNLDRTPEQLEAQAKQLTAKAMALSKAGKTEESVAAWEAVKRIDEARKAMTTPTTTAGPGDADDIGARLQQALSAETMKSLQRDAEAEAKRLEVNADADAVLADPNADPLMRLLALSLRTEDPAPRGGAPTALSAAGDAAGVQVSNRVLRGGQLADPTNTLGTPPLFDNQMDPRFASGTWPAVNATGTNPSTRAGVKGLNAPTNRPFLTGATGGGDAGTLAAIRAINAQGMTPTPGAVSAGIQNEEPSNGQVETQGWQAEGLLNTDQAPSGGAIETQPPAPGAGGLSLPDDQSPDAGNMAPEPETQDKPAGYTRRPEREADIEKMVQAASKPMPDIVESLRLEGTDGNWYGPNGFPTGVTMTGRRRVDGFVYRSKDGSTGSQLFESREAAQKAWTDKQAEESEDFRKAMHERTDEEFANSRDYWIGKPEQGFQGELVDRAMAVFMDHVPERDRGRFSMTTLRTKTIPYILTAITTGNFNDMMRPDNKASRKTFETLTGVKLPPSLSKTQEMFTGKPFDILPETKAGTKPQGDTKKDEPALGTDKNIGKRGSWEIVDGMIQVTFPAKPAENILAMLKRDGFTWGGKKRPYWSAKATDTNKETADAAIGPAPAKKVGKNSKGQDVYEDGLGVRSYAEGGFLVTEAVSVNPGGFTGVNKSKRGPEYKTVEELAAEHTDQQKKSDDAVADHRKLVEIGQKAVPGVRLSDADEAGRMYLMWGKGDITESEWNAYVADLYASGKAKKPDEDKPKAAKSFKVEVSTDNGKTWAANQIRFTTREAADSYGDELMGRWYAATDYRVADSDDEPNNQTGKTKLSTPEENPAPPPPKADAAPKPAPAGVLSPDREARKKELEKRLRDKIQNRLQMGFDPVMLAEATELASIYIEEGARKFAAFARQMVGSLGDTVRPYLKSLYNGARDLPGMEEYADQMDPAAAVSKMTLKEIEDAILKEVAMANNADDAERSEPGGRDGVRGGDGSTGSESEDAAQDDGEAGDAGDAQSPPEAGGGVSVNDGKPAGTRGGRGGRGGSGTRKPRPGTKSGGEPTITGPRSEDQPVTPLRPERPKNVADRNHRIGPKDVIAPRGDDGKIQGNIAAIKLLQTLEKEGRNATPEEKKVLAQYVGWGATGVARALDSLKAKRVEEYHEAVETYNRQLQEWKDKRWPDYMKPTQPDSIKFEEALAWEKEYGDTYKQIRELVSAADFRDMQASTPFAHYTSSDVITRGIWGAVRRLGFKGGSVLETSAGVGHMLGLQPEDLANASQWTAVEMDSIPARILAKLYPEANVMASDFGTAKIAPASIDLIVGNVPFAANGPSWEGQPKGLSLHNAFLARSLRMLRPGGIMVAITSRSTMDENASDTFREWAATNSNLVGAIRLPEIAFQANAGTKVTTDILIFQKKKGPGNAVDWVQRKKIEVPNRRVKGKTANIDLNEYFHAHPEMMIGTLVADGLYPDSSELDSTMEYIKGSDWLKALDEAVQKLPENLAEEGAYAPKAETGEGEGTIDVDKSGVPYRVADGKRVSMAGKDTKLIPFFKDFVGLKRDALKLFDLQVSPTATDEEIESQRNKVRSQYRALVEKHGRLGTKFSDFRSDPAAFRVASLEKVNRKLSTSDKGGKSRFVYTEEYEDSDILTRRTQYPFIEPASADSIEDAVTISTVWKGTVDLDYMGALLKKSPEQVRKDLLDKAMVFVDPDSGLLVSRDEYLSGNVKAKLKQAEDAAKADPSYSTNVDSLKSVQPERKDITKVSAMLGASWVPSQAYEDFAKETLDASTSPITVVYSETVHAHQAAVNSRWNPDAADVAMGAAGVPLSEIIAKTINFERMTVVVEGDTPGSTRQDPVATAAVRYKQEQMQEKWMRWMKGSDWALRLEDAYNDNVNTSVARKYTPPAITNLPGSDPKVTLRPHQLRDISRGLGNSHLNAHEVGTGKTYIIIATAMEHRRLGLARKPMIVVQNSTVGAYARAFANLYPSARVLVPSDADFETKRRKRTLQSIASNDWDAVIIPQSQLEKIRNDPEREREYVAKMVDELEDAIIAEGVRDVEKARFSRDPKVKALARRLKSVKDLGKKLLEGKRDTEVASFETLGVDALLVDEAHAYKKLAFVTVLPDIKGMDTGFSKRGLNMLLKTLFVQANRGGKNVHFYTGTPITNTLAEAWTMMRYLRPDVLEAAHITSFDEFVATFAKRSTEYEMQGGIMLKAVERLRAFNNVSTLQQLWLQVADEQTAESAGIPRPPIEGGGRDVRTMPSTRLLTSLMRHLLQRYKAFENMSPKDRYLNKHIPGQINAAARAAAVDIRLINHTLPDDPGSKLNTISKEMHSIWKETTHFSGAQVLFLDRYRGLVSEPTGEYEIDDETGVSTPKYRRVEKFNAFHEMKRKLVRLGIPADEIAVVTDSEYDDTSSREPLFDAVRQGKVRIVLASSERAGVGVNMQERLVALHHGDGPFTAAMMDQREGRIWRQGNETWELSGQTFKPRMIGWAVTGSYDSGQYERLARKAKIQWQFRLGENVGETIEDDEDVISYAQAAANITGNPLFKERAELEDKIRALKSDMDEFFSGQNYLQRRINEKEDYAKSSQKRADEARKENEQYYQPYKDTPQVRVDWDPAVTTEEDINAAIKDYLDKARTKAEEEFLHQYTTSKKPSMSMSWTLAPIIANGKSLDLTVTAQKEVDKETPTVWFQLAGQTASKTHVGIVNALDRAMSMDLNNGFIAAKEADAAKYLQEAAEMRRKRKTTYENADELENAQEMLRAVVAKLAEQGNDAATRPEDEHDDWSEIGISAPVKSDDDHGATDDNAEPPADAAAEPPDSKKWYIRHEGKYIETGNAIPLNVDKEGLDPSIEFFAIRGRGKNAIDSIYEASTGAKITSFNGDPNVAITSYLEDVKAEQINSDVKKYREKYGVTPRFKAQSEGGERLSPSGKKRSPKAATERASKLDAADAKLARLSTGNTMRAAEPANDLDREYDRFLKRLGLNPVWFASRDEGLEGVVSSKDKNVYLRAGMDTDRAMAVPLHELLHKMRDLNPELFELLKKAAGPARIDAAIAAYRARLVAFAGPKSDFVRDFDASRDRQIEEGLATVMESMATDPEIRAAILAKPNIWARFKRWAKALLDKFGFGDGKSALRGAMLKAFDQMEKGGGPKPRGGGSDTRFSPAPASAEESTPLPERRYLDAALVAATKAVRGASRRGKRLADVVEAYAAQLEKQSGHSVDRAVLAKITKAWLRNLPTVTKDAMEQLESRYATATKEADEPATKKEARERRKATSEAISEAVATLTAKPDRNVSERAALAGKLKGMERTADQISSDAVRAMRKAHRQGKQVGAAAARAQGALALNRAIDALRMERTAHRMAQRSADAEGKVRNKLEYEGKIKAAVIRIADELPMRIKGKLIPAIKSANNVKHIVRAINRAKFEIARMGARDDMRIMARLAKKWGRNLNDTNRYNANQAMTGAVAAYKALRDIKVPDIKGHSTLIGDPATDAAETHATTISKALADMKQAVNEQRMEDANVQITRKLGTDDVRRDLMEGLNKQKELPQADVPSGNNPGAVRNFFRKYWNVRSLMMKIDGKADTGAAMSLFQRMKRAQRRHLDDKHKFEDAAERITRAQGYSSLAQFMAEVSGTLGTQGQTVVEARLQIYDTAKKAWETRKQKITLGQALYILASDPQTQHWAHRGTEFVFDDGKTTRFKIPDRTWGELERVVPVRALRAMKALKKEYDRQYFNGLNDVSKTLNGRYLDKVQDYWGVRRHRVDDELDGSKAMQNAIPALEAAGILQDRSGGRDPIIVGDFGTEIFRRSEAASHIVHKAKEIHIIRATLLSRPVLEKIARVYGDKIKDRLVATVQEFAGKRIEADSLGKIIGNINRSKVQLWVPTWLRNMGSIARLMSVMPITDIAAGFAKWAASPVETYRTLLKHSPELRERWNGSAGTMSFAMPGATTATHAGARKALVATMKQLASTLEPLIRMNFPEFRRRLASVDKPWTEMLDSLSIGNVFDSAAAGVAFHASKRRGMSDRVAAMAATEMFENVANTNTVLESTGMQQEAKGSLWRSMLMSFTSDIAKAQNLIIQARMRGPKELAKALAGILASIAFSASVTYAWNRLRGDESDTALEATQTRLVKDLVSIVPMGNTIGAPVVDKMMSGQWGFGAAMDTPIQGTASNLVSAMHDVYMGYKAQSEEDLYTAAEKYQSALTRAAGVTGDVIGLPISGYTGLLKKVEKNYE